jgi:hypothetical protein
MKRWMMLFACLLAAACGGMNPLPSEVPLGTWGGNDAGLLVAAQGAHGHIKCTLGDTEGRIPLDGQGQFDVPAKWNVNAYPIDQGIVHPARMSGITDGEVLTYSVRLTDTGEKLGPASVTLGSEPQMVNCPICSLAVAQSKMAGVVASPAPACAASGEITFFDAPGRRLGVKDDAGRMHTYTLDDKQMPRWTKELAVGQKVSVACRDQGEEKRPLATEIKLLNATKP